ncbi:hypothetical protein ACJJI5_13475 [Microbulbifer sp. EKSA008]
MAYLYSGAPDSDIPDHYYPMIQQYKEWHSDMEWNEVISAAREL